MSKSNARVVLAERQGEACIYSLRNSAGMHARITNYGGIVMSLHVPDRDGTLADVVLGYDQVADYTRASPYFGALVGRYGNRIAGARFSLLGQDYRLTVNDGQNCHHGGVKGFDKAYWQARPIQGELGPALELCHRSEHLDQGFPGNLDVVVRYTLTEDGCLRIDGSATTDQVTVVNLTHHSYFNLAGKGDVLDHQLLVNADRFTPVDANHIPTGELRPVAGTPLDFRQPTRIGERIDADDPQVKLCGGIDHNWVLAKPPGTLGLVARVSEPTSGRGMEVLSTAPGAQVYTANFLDGSLVGKGGWRYQRRCALCVEPQSFPNTPNQPDFPSAVLAPGETYRHTMLYRFFVE